MGMKVGDGRYSGTRGSLRYPGNNPAISPGDGFEWHGKQPPGNNKGAWYNPDKGVSWHPDLNHPDPIGPHWDYIDDKGDSWRVYEDGRVIKNEK